MAEAAIRVSPQPEPEAGVVAAGVYSGGRRILDIRIEEAGDWAKKPGHVVWIGLHEPSEELLRRVQRQFGLHELAIEDALHAHQRPKIEHYGDGLFVVARTAQMVEGRIVFGETHLFVGRGYIVSVRHGASASYNPCGSAARPRPRCSRTARTTCSTRSSTSSSTTTCRWSTRSRRRSTRSRTACSPTTLSQAESSASTRLRRDLVRLRSAVVPMVEVCRRLEHAELSPIDTPMRPFSAT